MQLTLRQIELIEHSLCLNLRKLKEEEKDIDPILKDICLDKQCEITELCMMLHDMYIKLRDKK